MEVLLEYRGSRRQITVASGGSLTDCVTAELRRVGRSRASVHTANETLQSTDERDVYLLQKWSPQWECYVDVRHTNEVTDGDRLTVIGKPKPPSKILRLFCCCCSSPDSGVTLSRKQGVSKNEEIQALDYRFAVESDTHSNWDSQSTGPTEEKGADDNQYVRDSNGRAAWKMVPRTESSTEQPIEDAATGESDEVETGIEQVEQQGQENTGTAENTDSQVEGEANETADEVEHEATQIEGQEDSMQQEQREGTPVQEEQALDTEPSEQEVTEDQEGTVAERTEQDLTEEQDTEPTKQEAEHTTEDSDKQLEGDEAPAHGDGTGEDGVSAQDEGETPLQEESEADESAVTTVNEPQPVESEDKEQSPEQEHLSVE